MTEQPGTDPEIAASNGCVTPGQQWTPDSGTDAGPEPIDPYALLAQTLAERRTLLRLCLYALDRARSAGVAERIEQGLASVGVVPIRPDGQVFDPTVHEAAGTVPTEDANLDGVVAETEVPGFADNGRTLRVPVVTVYQVVR